MCGKDQDWWDIIDTVGGYKVTENKEEEIDDGNISYSVFALDDMRFFSEKVSQIGRNDYVS